MKKSARDKGPPNMAVTEHWNYTDEGRISLAVTLS